MMTAVLDTNNFFTVLLNKYNIHIFENKRTPYGIYYIGEAYSIRGEVFIISVIVKKNTTEIKIFKRVQNNRICVFQKNYSTLTDKHALSKSVSIFKFLDKALF